MLEEIKKEIENITHIFDGKAVVRQHDIFKILDKYKCRSNVADVSQLENKELLKYKNAWEELLNGFNIAKQSGIEKTRDMAGITLEYINYLKQKHNIESE